MRPRGKEKGDGVITALLQNKKKLMLKSKASRRAIVAAAATAATALVKRVCVCVCVCACVGAVQMGFLLRAQAHYFNVRSQPRATP